MKVEIEQPVFDTQALAQIMELVGLAVQAPDLGTLDALLHEADVNLHLLEYGFGSSHFWVKLRSAAQNGERVLLITE